MAKRSFELHTYTPTATNDGTALSNGTYQNIEASATTMYLEVMEIYCGGQASASAVNIMNFARTQLPATTPTALAGGVAVDGFMKTFSTALSASAVVNTSAATGPVKATLAGQARLNLSFNAFGGIVRWVAAPGEEWGILGTTTSVSSSVLSAYTGGSVGLMGSHLIYEIFAWAAVAVLGGSWLASVVPALDFSSSVL